MTNNGGLEGFMSRLKYDNMFCNNLPLIKTKLISHKLTRASMNVLVQPKSKNLLAMSNDGQQQ